MESEEKPDGIGLGDTVFSDTLNIGGVVKALSNCPFCKSGTLVFDDCGKNILSHYHMRSFKVVNPA